MKKSRLTRRARNNIEGASRGIPAQDDPFLESGTAVHKLNAVRVAHATPFSAAFEEIIEIIARDRVFRAMRARLQRRLLIQPPSLGEDSDF